PRRPIRPPPTARGVPAVVRRPSAGAPAAAGAVRAAPPVPLRRRRGHRPRGPRRPRALRPRARRRPRGHPLPPPALTRHTPAGLALASIDRDEVLPLSRVGRTLHLPSDALGDEEDAPLPRPPVHGV